MRNRTSNSSSLRSLSSWRISNQLSSLCSFVIPGATSRNTSLANWTSFELSTMAFACFLQKPKHWDCAAFGGKASQEMHVGQEVLLLGPFLFLFLILPRSCSERMSLLLKANTFPIRQACYTMTGAPWAKLYKGDCNIAKYFVVNFNNFQSLIVSGAAALPGEVV